MDELDKEDKGKINFDNLKNKIKNINMTRNHNKMENAQPGMNMEYTYSEKYYESQKLSFSAEGAVKTKDVREINFQLDLKLSRSYYQENYVKLNMGEELVDPLVINYDGNLFELSNTKFEFDLNNDGVMEPNFANGRW